MRNRGVACKLGRMKISYSWSHKGFFLISVINHFLSYKSCLDIQTAVLTFNKFIHEFKCFFVTTGVKNYLLMTTEVDINSACKDLGYVCVQSCICATCPKHMRSREGQLQGAGRQRACHHTGRCHLLLQPPLDTQLSSSRQKPSKGPGVPAQFGVGLRCTRALGIPFQNMTTRPLVVRVSPWQQLCSQPRGAPAS